MSRKIETIRMNVTPKQAWEWLEQNKDNRKLTQSHIASLARTMTSGDWQFNGESLKFDPTGNILDGQHRLWACTESKLAFQTLVTTNLPRAVFDTLDTGKIRTPSDILSINKESNVHILVAAVRNVGKYYAGTLLQPSKITNREAEALVAQHPIIREYVSKAVSARTNFIGGGIVAACWYLASRKHKADADTFFESLTSGTNLTTASPILVLRNLFIDVRSSPLKRLETPQRIELIIATWNLWRKGKTLKHFRLSSLSKASADIPNFK